MDRGRSWWQWTSVGTIYTYVVSKAVKHWLTALLLTGTTYSGLAWTQTESVSRDPTLATLNPQLQKLIATC
jgi:hypothetical protein